MAGRKAIFQMQTGLQYENCGVAECDSSPRFEPPTSVIIQMFNDGEWPSGKALGSGPRIGGSSPSSPAKDSINDFRPNV